MKSSPMLIKLINKKRVIHTILYCALSFIIVRDILKPGYVLIWHLVVGPSCPKINLFSASFYGGGVLLTTLERALCLIMPMWIIQKVLFFAIIFLAGYLAHNLIESERELPKYFAGIFYVINPVVYTYLLAGLLNCLLAYALVPLALKFFMNFLKDLKKKEAIKFLFILLIIADIRSHFFALTLIAITVIFIYDLMYNLIAEYSDNKLIQSRLGAFVLIIVLSFVVNSYWLIPAVTEKDTYYSKISEWDLQAFKPATNDFIEIASMYGFWKSYIYAKDIIEDWWIFFLLLIVICVIGISKNNLGFLILLILSFILSLGAYDPTGLYKFLYIHMPFFKGFRVSYYFASLMALCYSYLGANGVERLLRVKRFGLTAKALAVIAFAIPFTLSYNILFIGEHLKPVDYPKDWYEVKKIVDKEGDYSILSLPWHRYMTYNWNNNELLANPAPVFFDKDVVCSHTFEMFGVKRSPSNPGLAYIRSNLFNLTPKMLQKLNIKYIIVQKVADYKKFEYLKDRFILELDGDSITLYRNPLNVSRFYTLDWKPIYNYTGFFGVYYHVDYDGSKIFIPPNLDGKYWSGENKGFYVILNGNSVYYTRIYVYIISYAITVATIFALIFYYKRI